MEIPHLVVAIGCLGCAIFITLGLIIYLLFRKGDSLMPMLIEFLVMDLVLVSIIYFNVSVPSERKIGDQLFVSTQQETVSPIQSLAFVPDNRTVTIKQNDRTEELPYARIDDQTIKFISTDNKVYTGIVSESKYQFWSNADVTIILQEENMQTYYSMIPDLSYDIGKTTQENASIPAENEIEERPSIVENTKVDPILKIETF